MAEYKYRPVETLKMAAPSSLVSSILALTFNNKCKHSEEKKLITNVPHSKLLKDIFDENHSQGSEFCSIFLYFDKYASYWKVMGEVHNFLMLFKGTKDYTPPTFCQSALHYEYSFESFFWDENMNLFCLKSIMIRW